MTGYQEILTDPSYHGQIVTMTYPQIGNTGVNDQDAESSRALGARLRGSRDQQNASATTERAGSLPDYLEQHGIIGISGIDTRLLVRHIRENAGR